MSRLGVEEHIRGVEDGLDDVRHTTNSFSISVVGLGRGMQKIEALKEIITSHSQ